MDINLKAKKLREELKKLGYNSRKISVVVRHYTSINVKIKDVTIGLQEIKKIADKYKSIDYCQISGEILEGGNDFVFVDYDRDKLSLAAEKYYNYCKNVINKHKDSNNMVEFFNNSNVKLFYVSGRIVDIPHIEIKKNDNFIHERYCCNTYQVFAESLIRIQAKHNFKINIDKI